MLITSPHNLLIKEIASLLAKPKQRAAKGLVVVEGQKECSVAANAGLCFQKILYCPEIVGAEEVSLIFGKKTNNAQLFEISQEVFAKIAYRESTGGIVAIAGKPEMQLSDLKIDEQSVFIVLESVEKPGNLGAICRIADAAQTSGVIICDPHTDIYNPNAIRASLGCVFSAKVVNANFEETVLWLKKNEIASFAAELTAADFYHKTDLRGKIALIFGTEATGLTQKWINSANSRIKIPMRGIIDSLNVNTSVAVMVFEAMRQREKI
jgi:TrmH family RNA methyltransferase